MAPIKFEENIKDKLEKRTLSPSSDGWSKLSNRLDDAEKKSKKPIFWWLGVAAGLLVMLAISISFFNLEDTEKISPQLVEEDSTTTPLIKKPVDTELKIPQELVNQTKDKKTELPTPNEAPIKDYKKIMNTITNPKTQLADTNKKTLEPITKSIHKDANNTLETETEDRIIKDALAEAMKTLKSENSSVTDKEIDSLLKIASKELFRERLQNETTKIVNATQLLESVEDEMGQSFRSKVFEALKESYETVKTAVADRNN